MARPLAGRVARLEGRRPRVCPACGGGGPTAYDVRVPGAAAYVAAAVRPREPGRCRMCGRPNEFWIGLPPPREASGAAGAA